MVLNGRCCSWCTWDLLELSLHPFVRLSLSLSLSFSLSLLTSSCKIVWCTNDNFSFYICPVDGVAHRNIEFRLFVHRLRLAFWSIKSFETSECESRLVGRSPCYSCKIVRSNLSWSLSAHTANHFTCLSGSKHSLFLPYQVTGQCACRTFTQGRTCDTCSPQTYGLNAVNVPGCLRKYKSGKENTCHRCSDTLKFRPKPCLIRQSCWRYHPPPTPPKMKKQARKL